MHVFHLASTRRLSRRPTHNKNRQGYQEPPYTGNWITGHEMDYRRLYTPRTKIDQVPRYRTKYQPRHISPRLHQDYAKNIPRLCQEYAKNMPRICQEYAKNIQDTSAVLKSHNTSSIGHHQASCLI